jgi:uncharacterized protein
VLTGACRSEPSAPIDYVNRVNQARFAKDTNFRNAREPVPANLKSTLLPLAYYPVDEMYNVPAALTPSSDTTTLQMVYSDGAIRDVRQVGTLEFLLHATPLSLAAYVETQAFDLDHLFVPFGDLTNGKETYPSGRLLDLQRTPSGLYELDFNLAYNPSCYFSPAYSCPIPPKENRLHVEVHAGEKIKTH